MIRLNTIESLDLVAQKGGRVNDLKFQTLVVC